VAVMVDRSMAATGSVEMTVRRLGHGSLHYRLVVRQRRWRLLLLPCDQIGTTLTALPLVQLYDVIRC
jgi:hypothetical protein